MLHFILAHKDSDFPLDNGQNPEDFRVLTENEDVHVVSHHSSTLKDAKDHNGQLISVGGYWSDSRLIKNEIVPGVNNWQLGEIPAWTYIHSVLKDGEYATLHHYRRKLHHVPNEFNSLATPTPIRLDSSVSDHTAYCHSRTMVQLLKKHLNQDHFKILSERNFIYPYNIFCADKGTIKEWLDFENYVIGNMVREDTGPDIEEFVRNDADSLAYRPGKNIDLNYQRRFYAFISERLSTIFWTIKLNRFYKLRKERCERESRYGNREFDLKSNYDDGYIFNMSVELLEEGQTI